MLCPLALQLELHQATEALSAARGQLRACRSSVDSGTLASSRGSFCAPVLQAQGQPVGAYTQQAAAGVPGTWQQQPGTAGMAGSQQPNRPWDIVQSSSTAGLARFDYGGTQQQEPEQHWQPHSTARYSEQWEQQQHSTHSVRPQVAAEQEWLGEAAMPPPAQRSLRFYEQHADSMAAAPDRSPVDAAGRFNHRASLPQPYHPSRSATPEVAAAPMLGVQDFHRGPGGGPAGTELVLAGGLQPRTRVGSVDDASGSGSTPAPVGQRMQMAGNPQSPFGSEVTLQVGGRVAGVFGVRAQAYIGCCAEVWVRQMLHSPQVRCRVALQHGQSGAQHMPPPGALAQHARWPAPRLSNLRGRRCWLAPRRWRTG